MADNLASNSKSLEKESQLQKSEEESPKTNGTPSREPDLPLANVGSFNGPPGGTKSLPSIEFLTSMFGGNPFATAGNSEKPLKGIASVEELFEHWAQFSTSFGKPWVGLGNKHETSMLKSNPINHVKLDVEKNRTVFEYTVHFVPEIPSTRHEIQLIHQALRHLIPTKVPRVLFYYYTLRLYLPSQYITDKQEFESVIPDTENPVKIVITFQHKRKMQECPYLFSELFKHIRHVLYPKISPRSLSIPQQLESFPGYVNAVKEVEDGLLLICEDSYWRIPPKETTNIYELLQEYKKTDPENFKEIATRNLTDSIVLNHCNNKIYTIAGFAWNKTPKDTFMDDGKVATTFVDYYKYQYKIDIKDDDQPLLTSKVTTTVDGVKRENLICLVPELSSITGLAISKDFMVEENDGSHRPIKAETVYGLLQEYQTANPSNFKEIATKNLTGLVVFNRCNKRTYIIKNIAWNMTPKDTYVNDDDIPTSYIDYYKSQYNIDIKDVAQPLLNIQITTTAGGVRTEDLICLIPELSYLTGLVYTRKDLETEKKPDTSFFTKDQRMVSLRTYLEKVQSSEAALKVLADWGLKMVDATRVDDSPTIPPDVQDFFNNHVPTTVFSIDLNTLGIKPSC